MLLVADSGHSATNGYRNAGYGSALHSLDHGLHNITQALKATGMWTNTLLMLTADNGGDNPVGLASNYPLLGETGLLPPPPPPPAFPRNRAVQLGLADRADNHPNFCGSRNHPV